MRIPRDVVVSLALILSCNGASADDRSIQGTVIGLDGKPFAGVELRAEQSNARAPIVTAKTDAKGRYVFRGLPAAPYTITAIVGGIPKSRASITTQKTGWARVDFDLRKSGNASGTSADALRARDLTRIQQSLGGNINSMSFPGH